MEHILDNPIWAALNSGNRRLSEGSPSAKYFSPGVAPFAGLKDPGPDSLGSLYDMLPPGSLKVLITAFDVSVPASWEITDQLVILQLTGEKVIPRPDIPPGSICPLKKSDVAPMLELTALTKPGPFEERTIEFGNYSGIFFGGRLAAMAGRRFHAGEYVEVSAVCTHPDHTGKGYAGALVLHAAHQIIKDGYKPFLHVKEDNDAALHLYKKLGFVVRSAMNVNVIRKKDR